MDRRSRAAGASCSPAFFNGPTGPNLKTQWTQPITWSEGWRDRAYTVPVGGAFGPAATDFFCGAVGKGSQALVNLVHRPLEFSLVLGALVLLLDRRPHARDAGGRPLRSTSPAVARGARS